MADIQTTYTLTTPGPDITFNNGQLGDGTDKYWLTAIHGLDGPVIRNPVDLVPFGDGGIIHTFRLGPRRVVMDGILWIESSRLESECQQLRNALADDLKGALAAILTATGTLAWTPEGESAQTLAVYYDIAVDMPYSDNYRLQNFSFGLISASANPS
jgi:hypothetical protein